MGCTGSKVASLHTRPCDGPEDPACGLNTNEDPFIAAVSARKGSDRASLQLEASAQSLGDGPGCDPPPNPPPHKPPTASTASAPPPATLHCKAAGLTHIGYGSLKKENQDTIVIKDNSFNRSCNNSIFGVFDGHGLWGKPISQRCSHLLPHFFGMGLDQASTEGLPPSAETQRQHMCNAFTAAFLATEGEICRADDVDATGSGTTATLAYVQENDLWVASVGDSRVVLVQQVDCDSDEHEAEAGRPDFERFDALNTAQRGPTRPSTKVLAASQPGPGLHNGHGPHVRCKRAALPTPDTASPTASAQPAHCSASKKGGKQLKAALSSLPYSNPSGSLRSVAERRLEKQTSAAGELADGPTVLRDRRALLKSIDSAMLAHALQSTASEQLDIALGPERAAGKDFVMATSDDEPAIAPESVKSASGCPSLVRTVPLTLDHRAGHPRERKRLQDAGARVFPKRLPSGVEVGEPRMWLPDRPVPGLLLSRAVGDEVASTVGCIACPEVVHRRLRPNCDAFLVLASDGVWDVLTTSQVGQIVVQAGSPRPACKAILQRALRGWQALRAADNVCVVVVQLQWSRPSTSTPPGPASASPAHARPASPTKHSAGHAPGGLKSASASSLAGFRSGAGPGCRRLGEEGEAETWQRVAQRGPRGRPGPISRVVRPRHGPGSFGIVECEA